MKPFESFMATYLDEYLLYRETLGYSKKNLRGYLLAFDRYLTEQNAHWDSLKPSFFLEVRVRFKIKPRWFNEFLSAIRGLFQFLIRKGLCEENPIEDVPPLPKIYFVPFIFSPDQIDQLLKTLNQRIRNTDKHFFRDFSLYMAIFLLVRCGLRISEPLRLLIKHFRPEEATIYIEKTKFSKDRLIPVPKAVCREMENYLSARKSLLPKDNNPYLLAYKQQKPIPKYQVRYFFHQAVKDIGLDRPKKKIGDLSFGSPTPHSLRHSFAINTLKAIKDRGDSPQHALPVLAVYMGHSNYHYTGAYLKVNDAEHLEGLIAFAKSQQDFI